MKPGPSFALNGGTMPLSAVYQQSKNGVRSTQWGWKNSARSSPVPWLFACPPFLLHVLLNNRLEKTFTHLESKQTRQPYTNRGTLVSPSESASLEYNQCQLPSDILGCAGWAWTPAGWRETPWQGRKEWFSISSLWVNIYPGALGLGQG